MANYDLTGITAQANAIVEKGRENAKAAGINPDVVETSQTQDPYLTDYIVYTDKSGNTYVSGKGTQSENFLIPPSPSQPKGGVTDDINTARAAFEAASGGRASLEKALKSARYTGDYYTNINNAIRRYSVDTLQAYQDSKGKGVFPDYKSFINSLPSASGTKKTRVDQSFTDRAGTDRDINLTMMDLVGRPATKEEKNAYYLALNKAEKTAKVATTSISDGAGGYKNVVAVGNALSDADRTLIAANVARKSLYGMNVDALLATGNKAATDIQELQQYAGKYGISLTAGDALKYVAAGFGQKDYLAKQEERIRQTAITLHPQLKEHFLAGGTYKDIADQFKYAKQKKLGVVIDDANNDKDITDAVAKGMSINDFNRSLQSHPDWAKSPEANDIVDGFIDKIAKSWGLG
jgi:hypothetical protein